MIAILAFLAGASGAVTRFLLDSWTKERWRSPFPLATVVINITGSLLLGALAGAVIFRGQSSDWQTVLGTGFCGGYTTFSTASFETVRLLQQGRRMLALVNVLVSLVLSVAACAGGFALMWVL